MIQPNLNSIILSDLCNQLIEHLESIHMMPRTISNYKTVLKKLQRFGSERGTFIYSEVLINDFIHKSGFRERAHDPGHMYYRTCRMIMDLAVRRIPRSSYSRKSTDVASSDEWKDASQKYERFLKSRQQSIYTIKTKQIRLKEFCLFLNEHGIMSPAELDTVLITAFIKHVTVEYQPIYKYNLLQSLKDFLSFLFDSGLTYKNHSLLLSNLPDPKNSVLPEIYSSTEQQQILRSVDRNTLMGKRDYAIIQMIAQTGIRAIDIANLKTWDIDLASRNIHFSQHKTKKVLQLPMTEELFFSLYDYLSARNDYSSPNLFIRIMQSRADIPVTPSCISAVVRKYIHLSGIDCSGRKTGSHVLRHSLAVSMANDNTPFPVVSAVLGHSSSEVTKEYARISLDCLRILSLEVPMYER